MAAQARVLRKSLASQTLSGEERVWSNSYTRESLASETILVQTPGIGALSALALQQANSILKLYIPII